MTTERERQASVKYGCEWIVRLYGEWANVIVECRAATEDGAIRVAEAEHPGVPFCSANPGRIYHK
jgi:hypothetical protein